MINYEYIYTLILLRIFFQIYSNIFMSKSISGIHFMVHFSFRVKSNFQWRDILAYMFGNIFQGISIRLGKGSKIKLIIFAEFSAKGVPPPHPPFAENNYFFFQNFFIGLK